MSLRSAKRSVCRECLPRSPIAAQSARPRELLLLVRMHFLSFRAIHQSGSDRGISYYFERQKSRDVSPSLDMTKKVTLRALINFAKGARETPKLVTDVSVGRNAAENP